MEEFIAKRMSYDTLQEKVLKNEAAIAGGGGGISVSNTAPKDAMVIVKANSSEVKTFVNTGEFSVVPVFPGSNYNLTEVQPYLTSVGIGGRMVERTQKGHKVDDKEIPQGNINLPPKENIPSTGDFAASVNLVNQLLGAKTEATIRGIDIPKNNTNAGIIDYAEYGLFFIMGDNITVSYTGNGTATNIKAKTHILIKALMSDGTNRMIHIYTTTLSVTSNDCILNSSIDVTNGSNNYGCRVMKIPMKAVQ